MADNTVNPQITDAVTQANAKTIGESPASALGTLYQESTHPPGLEEESAIQAQVERQQTQIQQEMQQAGNNAA